MRIPPARWLALLIATGTALVGTGVALTLQPLRADAPDIPPSTVRAAAPPSDEPPAGTAPAGVHAAAVPTSPVPAAPVSVTLPGTPQPVPLVPVGVVGSGELALPERPSVLGWYAGGAVPGAPGGTALVAGHLDSARFGAGPLRALMDAGVGDAITVTDATGGTHRYAISARTTYRKADLPPQLFRATGPPRLALVTCGGPFDRRTGHYADNVVVLAVPLP